MYSIECVYSMSMRGGASSFLILDPLYPFLGVTALSQPAETTVTPKNIIPEALHRMGYPFLGGTAVFSPSHQLKTVNPKP